MTEERPGGVPEERSEAGERGESAGRSGIESGAGSEAHARPRTESEPGFRQESRSPSAHRPGAASASPSPSPSADPSRAGSRPGEGRERPGRHIDEEEPPRAEREHGDRGEAEEPGVGVAPKKPGRDSGTGDAEAASRAPGTGAAVPEAEATASDQAPSASPASDAVAGPEQSVEPVLRILPLGSGLVLIGLGCGLAFLGLRLRRG
ncbi:hypothetical protein N4P33_30660 [Streptomyces sp. 15-116A]|nr:hypothetical protein [Streptomyces sp. 15-116A]